MNDQLQEMRAAHPRLEYINDEWHWRCLWVDYTDVEFSHYGDTPESAVKKAYAAWQRSVQA